ncbi:phosphoglycerate mutase-like protein [Mycena albidolilacea]|uniref:Phosphoglycerate mutase-like protein n=1 Tax=Mycena albidolilacea TaxID=1033008 RepID=A0AAD7F4S1_9AGAR|nr:phosphoglycerate mutase-like protein [Mycena albidolilacea]
MPTERGSSEYKVYNDQEPERESLLPSSSGPQQERYVSHSCYSNPRFGVNHLTVFVAGTLACFLAQYAICGSSCFSYRERHNFPPANPTNVFPSLFPTSVGYAGKTPTGAEAAIVATAPSYPLHNASPQLVAPSPGAPKGKLPKEPFDLFKKWGNLSPWYSVPRTAFGVDSGPETPPTCRVTGLHLLHRHGARYPTAYASYGGPVNFSSRLHAVADKWNASGELEFMNEWTYGLGGEILTPFGRQQLFDLGISTRLKYGFLLKNFTESNTIPVFRSTPALLLSIELIDRMLVSAMNFAIGFFGYPFEGQYQQSITIGANGFNTTLAPYKTCPNASDPLQADHGRAKVTQWAGVYLAGAVGRLRPLIKGYELQVEDVYVLQQLCAYEGTVALGYSKFCELFTEEWDGYNSAFGFALGRPLGIGYVLELVARLTHTPIATHNSSTNGTLNDPATFPLGQSRYVDATHEVVVLQVLTALGLSTLAAKGTFPADHIPQNRTFRSRELAPFVTNVHFQLLSCTSLPGPQIRVIVNDGVVPLTGLAGCGAQKDGMCSAEAFVEAQRENIGKTDWEWACHGDWDVPEEWETTTGEPPARGAR